MKKLIAFCLVLILVFSLSCQNLTAYAVDPITPFIFGGAAAAFGNSVGMGFAVSSAGFSDYMTSQVQSWLDGRDIASVIVADSIRTVAGKLVIAQSAVAAIKDFLLFLKEKLGLGDDESVTIQTMDGIPARELVPSWITGTYYGLAGVREEGNGGLNWLIRFQAFNGQTSVYNQASESWPKSYESKAEGWYWTVTSDNIVVWHPVWSRITNLKTGERQSYSMGTVYCRNQSFELNDFEISQDGVYAPPNVDVGYQWEGTIDGTAPDTNLEDLIGGVYESIDEGILDVTGEVTEVGPAPTPVPTVAPDIPLQDVPWEGLNDLIGSSTDTIDDAIQDQTDAITGAQEATTEAVNSLTETIEGALETPTTEELPNFKFDLRELFPFCIPFDIYRLLSSFDAEPQAPHVQLPIVIDSINFRYNLDLDFSAWNPVAQAMRTAELIVYAIALAWATGKVIKW